MAMRTLAGLLSAAVVQGGIGEGSMVLESFLQVDVSEFVRLENGRELEASKPSEALGRLGFQVEAIHTLHETDSHLVLRRHGVAASDTDTDTDTDSDSASESKGTNTATATSGPFQNEREKVLAFMNLNVIAYPRSDGYSEDVMTEIISNGDSAFGSEITNFAEEAAAWQAMWDGARDEVNALGALAASDADDPTSFGVHATEFKRPGFGRVLCFRGSYGLLDFGNVLNWLVDWVEKKQTVAMGERWSSLGLPPLTVIADETPEQIASNARAMRGRFEWAWDNLVNTSKTLAADNLITREEAEEISRTGYWVLTKAIVERVYYSLAPGETLYLTGHSQGGSRAALSSMYLKKKYNKVVEAVTFGSVGGACWAQQLGFSQGNMLADVDPTESHDQVTDYVHALDPYGHMDYDVGGTCTLGVAGISDSAAARYCHEPLSHSAPTLAVASGNLSLEYKRCRYFTHFSRVMKTLMLNETILLPNGTTDGGCVPRDLAKTAVCY